MKHHYKNKKGFTLAEVLITLGIIGVVAAITMPAVIENTAKQQVIEKLKKAYTTISQGLIMAQADHGPIEFWPSSISTNIVDHFNTYWKPYYKNAHICKRAISCGYKSDSPWRNLGGGILGWPIISTNNNSSILFALSDGTIVFMPGRDPADSGNYSYFFVDVNGAKMPNILGKDVFIFVIKESTRNLLPYGYSRKYEDLNCKENTRGNFNDCTAKIMRDGWQMKNDYPW